MESVRLSCGCIMQCIMKTDEKQVNYEPLSQIVAIENIVGCILMGASDY